MMVPHRRQLRLHSALSAILLVAICGLLAWLSTRYHHTADWTSGGRHTLSEASTALLARLQGPVEIIGYARPDAELRGLIEDLIERFRRIKPDIGLRFVDPDKAPDEIRDLGIQTDGELVIRYSGRSEHVEEHTEEALTNALQRVLRGGERFVVFLEGHGERNPVGHANHDLDQFAEQLGKRGIKVQGLNLASHPAIPDNTSVLVITTPEVDYLPREVEIVSAYLKGGGNLLWLADPGPLHGLDGLAAELGLKLSSGTLVDPATAIFGIDHPAIVPVASYPPTAPVAGFRYLTVFPYAREIKAEVWDEWQAAPLLSSGADAWIETGKLEGELRYDEGSDHHGPLDIALRLTRNRTAVADIPKQGPESTLNTDEKAQKSEKPPPEQRVVVFGDGDFLSNSYLGNSGNLDLGLKTVNWLASDEALIEVPAGTAIDRRLDLSDTQAALISTGFLMLLPAVLGGMGFFVWLRRRRA
ncbi:MAG: GldG family protein [Gammaproteobacteria bacterium]|nr:GldG family protein [Gammaproteobacteria bacterium]